jgi:Tfp pilus assembly protein PilF
LCAPFRKASLTSKEIDKGINTETELPVDFGARRLTGISVEAYNKAGIHPDTIKLILRSEARLAKDDKAGARQALEEATVRDDRLPSPHFMLAQLYETAGEYDKAIERYRKLQQIAPDNPLVLNNLAYALAVRKNNPQEALPLAEKAHGLVKGNPNIADTLGWIYHLAGQDEKAVKVLEEAVRSAPGNADIHLHFAIVSAATGNKLAAEIALKRALEIDPKLEQNEEVKQLRAKMK